MMTQEALSYLANLGSETADARSVCGVPYVVVPNGCSIQYHKDLMERPKRIERKVRALTPASFIEYFRQFQGAFSRVFCNTKTGAFIGIIDYHGAGQGEQGWCAHTVSYECPLSEEWKLWKAKNGTYMMQAEFAEFIEERAGDIVTPSAADMLEISTTLEAKKGIAFKSGVRLDNGAVNLSYVSTVEGRAGTSGQLQIPTRIGLGIRIIHKRDPYAVEAMFRYRITTDGELKLKYDILNAQKAEEAAIGEVFKFIAEQIGEGLVFEAE